MFFLVLPFVLAEILIFTTWTHFYDFWNVFFAYFAPSFLGAMMLARSGQSMMSTLRGGIVPGQMPGNAFLHKGAIVLGALFLMIPLFLPRVLAILLIVPGLRHLSIQFFKVFLYKKLTRMGGFSFTKFGTPGGPSGRWSSGPSGPWRAQNAYSEQGEERDARVVDITPLEITHGPSKNEPPKKS